MKVGDILVTLDDPTELVNKLELPASYACGSLGIGQNRARRGK